MDNRYKRLAKNSFWTLIGNAGSKALGFLLLPIYTRWLGVAGFGESDLVTTYSSLLVCVMTMCVSEAIFVFTKNESKESKQVYYSTSLVSILGILTFWLFVWECLDSYFSYYGIKNSFSCNLWMIYGIVVTTFLQQYSQQFVLSLEKIRIYSLTGILYSLFTFIFSYWLIPLMGVRGYILSIIYSNLLTAIYSFFFSKSYCYFSLKSIECHRLFVVLRYSVPLIPNGIMWWLVSALNRPVMEYNLDYSAIGIYAIASRFPSVIIMVFTVFSVAWNISVFEEFGKKNYDVFYKKTFRMLFFVIIMVASGVIVMSEIIISIFAAPEFYEAWKYMIILIIGAVFSCLSSFFGTSFGVVKQSKYYFYSSAWGAITAIALNLLLIPLFGLWGAAISMMMSFLVMMLSRYVYSLQFVKSNLVVCVLKYVIVMIAVAGITYLIDNLVVRLLLTMFILSFFFWVEREITEPVLHRICSIIRKNE